MRRRLVIGRWPASFHPEKSGRLNQVRRAREYQRDPAARLCCCPYSSLPCADFVIYISVYAALNIICVRFCATSPQIKPEEPQPKLFLTMRMFCGIISKHLRPEATHAGVAELADARDLKSRGSDPVPVRPRSPAPYRGVEQLVARRAHNPEVAGSSPVPATKSPRIFFEIRGLSLFFRTFSHGLFCGRFLTHILTHTGIRSG